MLQRPRRAAGTGRLAFDPGRVEREQGDDVGPAVAHGHGLRDARDLLERAVKGAHGRLPAPTVYSRSPRRLSCAFVIYGLKSVTMRQQLAG